MVLLLLVVFSNNDVTGGGGMVGMGWTPSAKIPLPTALLSGSGTWKIPLLSLLLSAELCVPPRYIYMAVVVCTHSSESTYTWEL
jgi:hypothetical protein